MRKITFYLFIILCLLLTSCGGSGGGSDDPSGGGNGNGGNGGGNGNGGSGEAVIPPSDDYLCFTANEDGCSISTTVNEALTSTPSLEYSTDKENWEPFIVNSVNPLDDSTVPFTNAGDKVYIRATGSNATFSEDGSKWIKFVTSGSVSASGNIMSLLDKNCGGNSVPSNAFRFLFENTTLTTAPKLPATTLAERCYFSMFAVCIYLTTAPDLPATTLAEDCYYGMFLGCSSLTTAPELPATTLAMGCYYWMFYGCSNLNSITVNFTTWNDDCTSLWVYGVPSGGTFICPDGLPHINPTEFGYSRIPTGWTVNP